MTSDGPMNLLVRPINKLRAPVDFADMRIRRGRGEPATAPRDNEHEGILREARIVGLRSLQNPSISDIKRRRTEVWALMGTLAASCVAAVVVLSFWADSVPWLSGTALKAVVVLMIVASA